MSQQKHEEYTPIEQFDLISLRRTACFGACPIYEVTVYGDGRLEFQGEKFVKTQGKATSTLTLDQLKLLVAAFNDADFFSLKERYREEKDGCPGVATDNSSAYITLEAGGRRKSIDHYLGCQEITEESNWKVYPQALYNLGVRIDEIVGTERWIGTAEERIKD